MCDLPALPPATGKPHLGLDIPSDRQTSHTTTLISVDMCDLGADCSLKQLLVRVGAETWLGVATQYPGLPLAAICGAEGKHVPDPEKRSPHPT